jgi:pimeloyl-ACP methyl ester carboxylesterase
MNRYFIALVLSIFLYSNFVFAAEPTCGTRNWGRIEAKYCIEKPDSGDSDTVMVYFHGLGGNEKDWFTGANYQPIREGLRARGFNPWVVTISYGQAWLLTEVPNGLLFPKTVNELLPEIFNSIKPSGFTHKYLLGASMGGLNTSQVMLKKPEMFEKYMLICPAITTVGPYAPNADVLKYIARTGAQPKLVAFMLNFARLEFPNEGLWLNHSPIALADRNVALPQVYVSCGLKDEFGFQEGAQLLYAKIRAKSASAWWVPIPDGVHCAADVPSIVEFLTVEKTGH